MNSRGIKLLILAGVLILGALGAWWWHTAMELRWEPQRARSQAAARNRMLAATLLLRENGRKVTVAGSLGELALDKLPDGTLILADAAGVMDEDKAKRLLAWVNRGNTLVAQPRHATQAEYDLIDEAEEAQADEEAEAAESAAQPVPASEHAGSAEEEEEEEEEKEEEEEEEEEAPDSNASRPATAAEKAARSEDSKDELVETDPIPALLGVRLHPLRFVMCAKANREQREKECEPGKDGKLRMKLRRVQLPGSARLLEIDSSFTELISMPHARQPLWSDVNGRTVRVYQEGKGKIVMLSQDFFHNDDLPDYDHGEMLLALAALNTTASHVTMVQNLDALPWYRLLWQHFNMLLLGLAALLALLFWSAVRRFGPVLPEPVIERRSLMEHIDASGAWLWKAKGGRQVLLDAAREDTMAVIRRRSPRLVRLPDSALVAALARLCDLPEDHVAQALHQAAAPTSLHFTRQIRILQELRNHHER